MAVKPISIKKFDWWLNLTTGSSIGDNQFVIAKNVYYNVNKQIETRRWFAKFGAAVGSGKPVTSYFFTQRDDNLATMALCASGTDMYKYNETLGTWASIKSWLAEYETLTGRTTRKTRRDFATYKNIIYMCNGVDKYASYNGTTYTEYASAPKIRYINMNTDTLFWSWEDTNPITFYYSAPAPADWSSFYTNSVVVGWDELGRINGQNELGQVILAFKSGKIYSIDITNEKALPIDSQTGGFSDRTIANVGNSLVYLTERGVDTLKPRTGLDWSSALESSPLDEDVRELTNKITELQLNANTARYIKGINNYYITFDTNNDNIPDTTLVYNSLVKAWTQYDYPAIYDYWIYITTEGVYKYLFTSATTDQVYEMETGYDDDGVTINYEIQTKAFDFWEPGTFKTFEYVDIIGKKSKWTEIPVKIYVGEELVGGATIDDTKIINNNQSSQALWTRPIGIDSLTGDSEEDIPMYDYLIRVPLYSTGESISINMSSEWWIWILEKMRIGVNWEPIDVFSYANIW